MWFTRSMTLPAVALLLASLVVFLAVKSHTHRQEVRTVQQPLIGGNESKREGPWPECVGETGSDCARIIHTYASDVHVEFIPPESMVTMDFRTDRVRIHIDDDKVVTEIPRRG